MQVPDCRLIAGLPTAWLENYVRMFEAGRVQKHPQACFVNEVGECDLVGALAGAASGSEFVQTEQWARFLGSELEELSRRFEAGQLVGQQFYEEVLLALVERRFAAEGQVR